MCGGTGYYVRSPAAGWGSGLFSGLGRVVGRAITSDRPSRSPRQPRLRLVSNRVAKTSLLKMQEKHHKKHRNSARQVRYTSDEHLAEQLTNLVDRHAFTFGSFAVVFECRGDFSRHINKFAVCSYRGLQPSQCRPTRSWC